MISELRERKQELREGLDERNKVLFDTLDFLVRLMVLAAPFYVLLWKGWNPVWLRTLNAAISHTILTLVGVETGHIGTFVAGEAIVVDVSVDSTGWKSMIAVTALMLATVGEKMRKRAYGIIVGLTIVFIGNIARITSMMYAVEVYGADYEFIHTFLWRWGLTILVFVVWVLWLHWDGTGPGHLQSLKTTLKKKVS